MTTTDSFATVWITTDEELASACAAWQQLDFIAVDTEFLRRSTYFPITGLIQIGDGASAFLIDPQTIGDWQPLTDLMVNPNVVKVFHACSEDLDVFDRLLGVLPTPFFDTQIAEAYASAQWSMSYAKLVAHYLHIEVAKDETRSDWTVRPLTAAQERYAALDVIYLAQIYPRQKAVLEQKQMLDWALEDCESLQWQYQQNNDPLQNWQGVKASWRLDRLGLTVLKHLYIWRDETARVNDVPKGQVLKERTLWGLAKFRPNNHRDIGRTEELTPKQHRLYGDDIMTILEKVKALPESDWEALLETPLPSQAGDLSKEIRAYVAQLAQEMDVAQEVLLKRKLLDPIVRALYEKTELAWDNPQLCGWRRERVIEPILERFR